MDLPRPSATLGLLVCLILIQAALAGPAAASATSDRPATCAAGGWAGGSEGTDTNVTVETLVAPGATYDALTTPGALRAAERNGSLVPATAGVDRTWEEQVTAYRDVVVHRIELSGDATELLDRLAEMSGRSPTANFRALAATDTLRFKYYGASVDPPELALDASVDRGAIRAVPDRPNDTLTLVFDTDRLLFHPLGAGEPTTDTFVHGRHSLELTLPAAGGLVEETVQVEADYEVEPTTADVGGPHDGLVRLEPTRGATVRGLTNLAPGSVLTVRLIPVNPALANRSSTVTVNGSRAFAARFDLSGLPNGTVYRMVLEPGVGPPIANVVPTLVTVGPTVHASLHAADVTTDGRILYGPAVVTTHGGFLVVRNASGGIVAVSDALEPGWADPQMDLRTPIRSDRRLTVTGYRDVDGDGRFDGEDVPYRVDGGPLSVEITVGPDDPPSPTPTPAPVPATTAMTTTTDSPAPAPESPTESPGQPGFGWLVAAAGLLSAAGWSRRRR